jgi:hypothetical protein
MFTVTACRGRRHCNETIGLEQPFVLRLSRAGNHVSGVFVVESVAVPIEGEVSETGSLSARGLRPSPSPDLPTVDLTLLTSANDEFTQAQVAYEVRYLSTAYHYNPSDSVVQSIAGSVTQAVRGAVTPQTSFEGTWRGDAVIRDCSAVGWLDCYPDERHRGYPLTFVLTQSGDRVSGTFDFRRKLSVTGSVNGNTVTFDEATFEQAVGGGRSVFRLERCTLTRDVTGQLTGTLRYAHETIWNSPRTPQIYVSRYDADVSAVLIP